MRVIQTILLMVGGLVGLHIIVLVLSKLLSLEIEWTTRRITAKRHREEAQRRLMDGQ